MSFRLTWAMLTPVSRRVPASDSVIYGSDFAAEIDRAVIDLVRHRLGEGRLFGHVVAAADYFHGEPRHLQLLVAARVDLGKLGDRRHLPQQPERVEAALLQRAGRPRQLRGPADLAFNLADELSDLAGGGFRLLALNADQRGLLLLIREIDVEHGVGDQHQADHGDEQGKIFDKQPTAYDRCAGRRSCARRLGFPSLARLDDQAALSCDQLNIFAHRARQPKIPLACDSKTYESLYCSFYHLIGERKYVRRQFKADRFRSLQVDHKQIARRFLERQIGGLGTLENPIDQ